MFSRTPEPTPLGFFGRDRELARMLELAEEVRDGGRGRAVLITGEAGVGKSRLMAELRRRLREGGEVALECACRPADPRPHGPLVDLLAAGASMMREVGRRAIQAERALNLATGLAGAEHPASPLDLTPAFHETARLALIELAALHPPVLFVHDVHWADRATLELVRYLLENLLTDPAFDWTPPDASSSDAQLVEPAFRGLLVISFREVEAAQGLVEVARATAAVEHLPLDGFGSDAIRAFLQSDAVVERFIAASAGSPLALEQVIEALPDDPDALWTQQVEALPADARALLDALAVQREACTIEQLRALVDTRDVREPLADLVRRRVVRRSLGTGVMRFRFARAAAREAWYEAMPPDRRQALHRRVAERLAAGFGAEPEHVARHFLAGGSAADAVPYAIAAADRLQAAWAHARASELLEDVVHCAEGELKAEILDRLADMYAAAGDPDAARRALRMLAEADPERAGPVLDARRARLFALAGAFADARQLAERTLEGQGVDEATRRTLVALAADAAYRQGDVGAAAALATAVADPFGDDTVALEARNTLGKVHIAREDLDEAAGLFTRNLEISARRGLPDHQARALINLGVVDLQRGDVDAALTRFESARRLCVENSDLPNLSISLENLAVLHHRRQDYSRALSYYHESTAASRRLGRRLQLATTALNLADLYLTVGDRDRARRLADIAGEYIRRDRLGFLEPQRLMLEGDLARDEADPERAADRYGAAVARLEQGSGSNQRLGPLLWSQAELWLETGDVERAAAVLEQAIPVAGQSDALSARLHFTRGGVLAQRGQTDEALAELDVALRVAERKGEREVIWQVRARQAETRWARGERAETLQALAAAVEAIEQAASALPPSMRQNYREAPRRRAVADAMPRVRAGLAPDARLTDQSTPEPAARRRGAWRAEWSDRYPQIIGRDPSLFSVFNALDRVAGSDSMVLIRGESGTGKELVATALHRHSPRAQGPFVKVNCAAFVETLLLSELFGHEKGAFTGAISSKKGRFELADGGTLFLDEIGDISPNTQVALLRVLQEGTFERVGGAQTLSVNVRVICATHRNLEKMVREGAFRADLYYRLRGVIVELPPLRDRRSDIPRLVRHFLSRRPTGAGGGLRFDRPALASLIRHDWPGNIRELENVVRSVALFADGQTIGLRELMELGDMFGAPDEQDLVELHAMLDDADDEVVSTAPAPSAPPTSDAPAPTMPPPPSVDPAELVTADWLEAMIEETGSLSDLKKRIEFEAIARALRTSAGNITHAASRLGMKRPRLSQIIHANPELAEIKAEALQG